MITELTEKTFKKEVMESKMPVIVDFWADWCGPCKMMAPIFHKLADEFKGKIKFCKVNVDEEGSLSGEFGIRSIPTLVVFKQGKEVDRLIGAMQESVLKQKLQSV